MMAVPLTLAEANRLVARWHRHHRPILGHRFSIGAQVDGQVIGAVIVGHPAARHYDQHLIAEVRRLVTNGHRNACSFLYQRAARAAKEMGFVAIQTYILESETGVSLRACGWTRIAVSPGGRWRDDRRHGQMVLVDTGDAGPTEPKVLYKRDLVR